MAKKILILIIAIWIITISCAEKFSSEEIERRINSSELLKRVDRLCGELPKPRSFKFVVKQIGGNSVLASISYQFESSESLDDVGRFYAELLESDGWVFGSLGFYEKGRQRISVSAVNFRTADYSITCSELR